MKISRVCALALLLVVASAIAFADGIQDPQVIIHGAGGLADCGKVSCMNVGSHFSFTVPQSGSGTLYFTNTSGQNWTSLTLIERGVPAADIKCHSSLFMLCSTETLKNGAVEILLSTGKGGDWPNHGIPNGSSFAITFACVQGGCWPGGLKVSGTGNGAGTVPEPATAALMVTGLGALIARRKRWKIRLNS